MKIMQIIRKSGQVKSNPVTYEECLLYNSLNGHKLTCNFVRYL